MSQFHPRPDAARRGPTRLRPQDVASPTRGPTLELLRSHVRPCRFATCFSAARAKADAARRAGPPPPTANPPPTPSHVRHGPTRTPRPTCWPDTSDRAAASAAVARPTWADATATSDVSARHLRQRGRTRRRVARPTWADADATSHVWAPTPPTPSRARRRRTSDMGRRDRQVPLVVVFFSTSPPASPQRRAPQVRHNATKL